LQNARFDEQETLFEGRIFELVRESLELPSGLRQTVEWVKHPGAVAIAAQDAQGRLLLVRQYRAAVRDWTYEIPAGRLEAGEVPQNAARRELEEETGLRAGSIEHLQTILPAPGFASERLHIYVARDLQAAGADALSCDPDEEIEVTWLGLDEVIAGASQDAKTLVAALLLQAGSADRPSPA